MVTDRLDPHSRLPLPAQLVIASATHIAAKLCRMEGKLGVVAPGAFADFVVVDGDPLQDLALLTKLAGYAAEHLARHGG